MGLYHFEELLTQQARVKCTWRLGSRGVPGLEGATDFKSISSIGVSAQGGVSKVNHQVYFTNSKIAALSIPLVWVSDKSVRPSSLSALTPTSSDHSPWHPTVLNNSKLSKFDIESQPPGLRSRRKITGELLVDDKVAEKLPPIESGQPLRWDGPFLVISATSDSRISLVIYKKHYPIAKYHRYQSESLLIPDMTQIQAKTIDLKIPRPGKSAYTATVKFISHDEAEAAYNSNFTTVERMSSGPFDGLRKACMLLRPMFEVGNIFAEINPIAKIVFAVSIKACEKIEKLGQCDEDLKELLERLVSTARLVGDIRGHARPRQLRETVRRFLELFEDVAIFAMRYYASQKTMSIRRLAGRLPSSGIQQQLGTLSRRLQNVKDDINTALIAAVAIDNDLERLMNRLKPVEPSGYDPSQAYQYGTCSSILADIGGWVDAPDPNPRLLWLHGQKAAVVSAVAASVCVQLSDQRKPLTAFFCKPKQEDPDRNDPLRLINSVVYGLCVNCPPYARVVLDALGDDPQLSTSHLGVRYKGLVSRPLEQLHNQPPPQPPPQIVIIEALDECGNKSTRKELLKYFLDMAFQAPWLKIIVTSRSNGDIHSFFKGYRDNVVRKYEINEDEVPPTPVSPATPLDTPIIAPVDIPDKSAGYSLRNELRAGGRALALAAKINFFGKLDVMKGSRESERPSSPGDRTVKTSTT